MMWGTMISGVVTEGFDWLLASGAVVVAVDGRCAA